MPSTKYRTWFTGKLETRTALHIGSGTKLSTVTKSPIIRGADNTPIIPGSSLKGALRSASERLLRALGHRACMVFGESDIHDPITECITTNKKKNEVFRKLKKGETLKNGEREIAQQWYNSNWGDSFWKNFAEREDIQLKILKKELCRACLTWGSPFTAGHVRVPDMRLSAQDALGHATEIRDGVGLDRDSGTAASQVKFDLEVLPAGAQFNFELIAEPDADLAVVALAVGELWRRNVPLGGCVTRGLGEVQLNEFCIKEVNLADPIQLVDYLTEGERTVYEGKDAVTKLNDIFKQFVEESNAA